MRAYKVKSYNELERDIDIYCMVFGVLFCLVYFVILTGAYVATYYLI
jgi:hypothetical protein